MANDSWREHFSVNAGDLIQIHRWLAGDTIAQRIILECFRRSPKSHRINEATVCQVLHELNLHIQEDGTVTIESR